MATIQIPEKLCVELQRFADSQGRASDDLIREALVTYLEDLEDVAIATERLANPGKLLSFDEVKKNLGLDD
jgi:predicted DNA-binding protein